MLYPFNPYPVIVQVEKRKKYGFWSFVGDVFMVCITGGLWLIWIFCREMRKR